MIDPDLAWLPDWFWGLKCLAIVAGLFAITCCVAGHSTAGRVALVVYWALLAGVLLWGWR